MSGCGCAGTLPCGCCDGTEPVTPESVVNRPGLTALRYRAGTHATFLETMRAALSADRRLDGLAARDAADASIALLDGWAMVADVLTFYQERIANEGYLATATERRSVLELANLVGYRARPGLSASVYVAYTLDAGARTVIPEHSVVRSVPADGEGQQAFETADALAADAACNNLQVRRTRPHTKASILTERAIVLEGLVSTLRVGDPLFIEFASEDVVLCRVLTIVLDATANATRVSLEEWAPSGRFQVAPGSARAIAGRLRPFLQVERFGLTTTNATVRGVLPMLERIVAALDGGSLAVQADFDEIAAFLDASPPRARRAQDWIARLRPALDLQAGASRAVAGPALITVDEVAAGAGLLTAPSLAPRSLYHRADDLGTLFDARGEIGPESARQPAVAGATLAALAAFKPALRASLAAAYAHAVVTAPSTIRVYSAIRTAPFGHNAPARATTNRLREQANGGAMTPEFVTTFSEWELSANEDDDSLFLEREFEQVQARGLLAVQQDLAGYTVVTAPPKAVSTVARSDYGLAGKVTRVVPGTRLFDFEGETLALFRRTKVFLADAPLPLAEQPIADPVCSDDPAIELDGLYDGLTPGRWIILAGERTDTTGTSGVPATELLLIGDVQHRVVEGLAGDRLHTFLRPVVHSAFCYRRESLRIHGNVVRATHGETRKEVLGSGDASVAFPQYPLKQPPLTHVPAPTASGSASTLHVFVDDLEWHEADGPVGLAPYERAFFTRTGDDGVTRVTFGDGTTGARVPTGNANLRAAYRNGLGRAGNVQSGQLTILGTKPLGVKEVVNPLRASGGADRDSRDQIRDTAPLAVTALDRLVSVADYAAFARTFQGIGKAAAAALTDGHRRLVHVTIAGVDDIPIDPTSDVYANLRAAMRRFGDPHQPQQLDVRRAKFLVLQAGVKVHPDYPWETTAPALRAALLDAFRFDRRALGQSAFLSEVLAALQRVPGVVFVDADRFGAIAEEQITPSGIAAAVAALTRAEAVPARAARATEDGLAAAEIAYFTPDVPATIALNQL